MLASEPAQIHTTHDFKTEPSADSSRGMRKKSPAHPRRLPGLRVTLTSRGDTCVLPTVAFTSTLTSDCSMNSASQPLSSSFTGRSQRRLGAVPSRKSWRVGEGVTHAIRRCCYGCSVNRFASAAFSVSMQAGGRGKRNKLLNKCNYSEKVFRDVIV